MSNVTGDKYTSLRFDVEKETAVRADLLEVMDYQYPGQEVDVEYYTEEFTSVCPWTGLPDFGGIYISYVPDKKLIELKSLKYYLLTYRNVGVLQEHVVVQILNDLVAACQPLSMEVEGDFALRGGMGTRVKAAYVRE